MIKNVSKLNLSSGSLIAPGRCRLAAIQLAIADPDGLQPRVREFDFDKNFPTALPLAMCCLVFVLR